VTKCNNLLIVDCGFNVLYDILISVRKCTENFCIKVVKTISFF